MSSHYDCIIIGAGPSGATAAYHLSKRGCSVLLIERESLPRYKPCGGGVSPEVAQWFDFDLSPTISHVVNKVCCTWRVEEEVESTFEDSAVLWMVRREVFDYYLVEQAKKQGAEVRDQTQLVGLEWQSDHWCVKTNKEDLHGQYVIAADGAKGITAKLLGFSNRKRMIAGALEAEAPAVVHHDEALYLELGLVKGGYLWNFPKSDGYSIGIGVFKGKAPKDMRGILGKYCESFGINLQAIPQYGHPVCLWDGNQALHTQNALLAGEAACLVDPFSAEGIRPSIYSGMQAAIFIHRALGGDDKALEAYTKHMECTHGAEMVWARRLSILFSTFPKLVYDQAAKNPAAIQAIGKLLGGQLRYGDLARKVTQKLGFG